MPAVAVETESAELTHVKELFEEYWSNGLYPVMWQNPADGQLPVEPALAREAAGYPATFLAVEIQYDGSTLITGTTTEHRGRVVVSVWVEESADEQSLRERLAELRTMFREHGDAVGIQFLAGSVSDKAFPDEDAPWYGRAIAFPFVRYEEA